MNDLTIYFLAVMAVLSAAGMLAALFWKPRSSVLGPGEGSFLDRYLKNTEHKLDRSRTGIRLKDYLALQAALPVALTAAAVTFTGSLFIAVLCLAVGLLTPDLYVTVKKTEQDRRYSEYYERALSQMAASLNAGMTVEQAVDSVISCTLLDDVIRSDFSLLAAKIKLGASIPDAFYEYAYLTENEDVYDTATAISITQDVGGEAGDAITKIQKDISERLDYRRERASMMAESRMIILVAEIVPFVVLGIMYLMMPDLLDYYFSNTMGRLIFAGMIILMLAGSVITRKMTGQKADVKRHVGKGKEEA